MRAVLPPPRDVAVDRNQWIAVLQVRAHGCNQRVEPVVAPDLAHPLDHPAAEGLAAVFGRDQDLECTQDGRLGSALREPGFDDGVDPPVGEACDVSVPCCGDRVAPAYDLLSLVVPRVEVELGVFGDHTVEEAIEDRAVVHELWPDPLLKAGYVREPAGPLGTRRELERQAAPSLRADE